MMGYLADKWSRKHVMILIYAIVAAAIPLLFLADRPWARPLFAVLFGIGLGGDYMIIPLMAADLFGTAHARSAHGDHHHGRRRGGSDRSDAGRRDSRCQRQLRTGVFRPHRPCGPRRRLRRTPPAARRRS
jgi:hypothetical protein